MQTFVHKISLNYGNKNKEVEKCFFFFFFFFFVFGFGKENGVGQENLGRREKTSDKEVHNGCIIILHSFYQTMN